VEPLLSEASRLGIDTDGLLELIREASSGARGIKL
jgi:hypothetical protein